MMFLPPRFSVRSFSGLVFLLAPVLLASCANQPGAGNTGSVASRTSLTTRSEPTPDPISYAPTTSPSSVHLSLSAAINEVRSEIGPSVFNLLTVAPLDDGTLQFSAVVRCQSDTPGGCIAGAWRADLAQGDLAELESNAGTTDLSQIISRSNIVGVAPSGQRQTIPAGQGRIAAHQNFADAGLSENIIVSDVTQKAEAAGFAQIKVSVLNTLQPSVSVQVTQRSDDPPTSLGDLQRIIMGNRRDVNYEGLYIEVHDQDGAALARLAVDERTGAGRYWALPSYDKHSGIDHG